jgi:hypothetical protein
MTYFVEGERVEYNDIYASFQGKVIYASDRTDKVMVLCDDGEKAYIESDDLTSVEV